MACRRVCQVIQRRLVSSAAAERLSASELRSWRSTLFSKEQARQRSLYPRVEKIEVTMDAPGLQGTLLVMNKGMSTPYSCARHLTEWHVSSAALALVDGEPWHMHRPLTRSCSLTLLTFKDANPLLVNQAYWRSCASLLGQVLDDAFKEEYSVELLKIPEVPVTAGAFCCDVVLDPRLDSWTPSEENLRSLTREAQQLICKDLPWEPLEVTPPVALEIFSHSRYKQDEVEQMAASCPSGTVSLYRCGEHVTLSEGPLVARTGLCYQYEVTALHTLSGGRWGLQRRAQGLSLPLNLTGSSGDLDVDKHSDFLKSFYLESFQKSKIAILKTVYKAHYTVWRKLRKRAEKLVEIPTSAASTPVTTPPSPKATPAASQH